MSEESLITTLPVVPVKRTVLFPETLVPFTIGRDRSRAAVEAAMNSEEKAVVLVAQRDSEKEDPTFQDLYQIGTKAVIKQTGKTSEGHIHVLVQGVERMVLLKEEQHDPYMIVRSRALPAPTDSGPEVEALHRALLDLLDQLPELITSQGASEIVNVLRAEKNPLSTAYRLVSLLNLSMEQLQALLEQSQQVEVLRQVYAALSHELQILQLRHQIASQAQAEIGKSQREYFLRQQLKEIQQELGELEGDHEESDIGHLKKRIEETDLPEDVKREATREVKRLTKLPPHGSRSPSHSELFRACLRAPLD